jgi:hypothetical protein
MATRSGVPGLAFFMHELNCQCQMRTRSGFCSLKAAFMAYRARERGESGTQDFTPEEVRLYSVSASRKNRTSARSR